jgi:hypothetical protein
LSNSVTIKVVVSRINSLQVRVDFFRSGSGDDMVEDRADHVEKAVHHAVEHLIQESTGTFVIS